MTLSPVAQAVLDAALRQIADDLNAQDQVLTTSVISAALRAAVEQVLPVELGLPEQAPMQGHIRQDERGKARRDLLAIATELENAS